MAKEMKHVRRLVQHGVREDRRLVSHAQTRPAVRGPREADLSLSALELTRSMFRAQCWRHHHLLYLDVRSVRLCSWNPVLRSEPEEEEHREPGPGRVRRRPAVRTAAVERGADVLVASSGYIYM